MDTRRNMKVVAMRQGVVSGKVHVVFVRIVIVIVVATGRG